MDETSIVDWLTKQAAAKGKDARRSDSRITLGIGDDCAIFTPAAGENLVFTTDQLIEGIHFKPDTAPGKLGARVLARNLSDLASMGAEPRFCLVNVAVPAETSEAFLKAFFRGLLKLAGSTGTTLAGGDLAHSPTMHFDVTACGSVPRGKALRRDGAQVGDAIYVSGKLGKPWDRPIRPRLGLGVALRERATACIDISDGLAMDLHRLLIASSSMGAALGAELAKVPVYRGATLDRALHGGEDYELLFTMPARRKPPAGCVRIGVIVEDSKREAGRITFQGAPVEPKGYDHFRE